MPAPGTAPTAETRALFNALLSGDAEAASQLLQGPTSRLIAHKGPAGFSSLHAAVLPASAAPRALAPLIAAGAPLEEPWSAALTEGEVASMKKFLSAEGLILLAGHCERAGLAAAPGTLSPLALAVRCKDVEATRQLLALGPVPTAGLDGLPCAATPEGQDTTVVCQLLDLLLRHGANCLQPGPPAAAPAAPQAVPQAPPAAVGFLNKTAVADLRRTMLAHLERQLGEGKLRLYTRAEARELAKGAMQASHAPLLAHALAGLEKLLAAGAGAEAAAAAVAPEDAAMLTALLSHAVWLPNGASSAALQALLASPLPFVASTPAATCGALLGVAALHSPATRRVLLPLLRQAGCPLTVESLLVAVHELKPGSLAALLALGPAPAVETGRARTIVCKALRNTCCIHELLRVAAAPRRAKRKREAMQVLELLLRAGYRPTTYHNVPLLGFAGAGNSVQATFDPFDFHPKTLDEQLVFLARGGAWSPAAHHRWPDAFKAAARTLLLAASSAGAQPVLEAAANGSKRRRLGQAAGAASKPRGGGPAVLPVELVLRVLELAAAPMSGWL
ncbi:hypothetical protein ABPG75_006613 [Micractinium tetrahymenae]